MKILWRALLILVVAFSTGCATQPHADAAFHSQGAPPAPLLLISIDATAPITSTAD